VIAKRRSFREGHGRAAVCPVCRQSDRVEKASSVIGQNSGSVYVAPAGIPHRFSTALAMSLSMPDPPLARCWPRTAFLMCLSILVAVAAAAAAFGVESLTDPGRLFSLLVATLVIGFGFVLPCWTVVRTFEQRQSATRRLAVWERANERWQSLYYCFRDDAAFLKGENDFEAPTAVERLLFVNPAPRVAVPAAATPQEGAATPEPAIG
jgi:hypothetical protein